MGRQKRAYQSVTIRDVAERACYLPWDPDVVMIK